VVGINNISLELIRNEIIGGNKKFKTPYGERVITYADYTASGKTLKFIEKYLIEIQKYYANSHTEDDITGELMTKLVNKSEKIIKEELNASSNCSVIATGTGATGAIVAFSKIIGLYMAPATKKMMLEQASNGELKNMMRDLFSGKDKEKTPVVFIGPYEHHSNILIWRESLAEVVEIGLNDNGFLDLLDLEKKVSDPKHDGRVKIGSFSAASNITGVKTEVYEVAKILHKYNSLACFDFAASAPYIEINMNKDKESYFDAVYLSPHKFIGGPGSSGILVINSKLYDLNIPPTEVGGGTVDYVSEFGHDYLKDIEEREKAGTPGILQIMKAALSMQLKREIGLDVIEEIEEKYINKFIKRFANNENIEILGPLDSKRKIAIISFMIKYEDRYLHPRFITTLLNDLFGIQSRAGCSCAGPYGHKLLGIDAERSKQFRGIIQKGVNSLKPGWVRVNLHYSMSEEVVDFLFDAIEFVSKYAYLFLQEYSVDIKSGAWTNKENAEQVSIISDFDIKYSFKYIDEDVFSSEKYDLDKEFKEYFVFANEKVKELDNEGKNNFNVYKDENLEKFNWFYFINATNNGVFI